MRTYEIRELDISVMLGVDNLKYGNPRGCPRLRVHIKTGTNPYRCVRTMTCLII